MFLERLWCPQGPENPPCRSFRGLDPCEPAAKSSGDAWEETLSWLGRPKLKVRIASPDELTIGREAAEILKSRYGVKKVRYYI